MGLSSQAVTSIIFSCIELLIAIPLVVIFFRLRPGKIEFCFDIGLTLISLCCSLSLATSIYGFEENEDPIAWFALAQFFGDFMSTVLEWKARRNELSIGPLAILRALFSCLSASICLFLITSNFDSQIFLLLSVVLRFVYVSFPIARRKFLLHNSTASSSLMSSKCVDDWGLLINDIVDRNSIFSGLFYSSHRRPRFLESENVNDLEVNNTDGMSESLLAMRPSFVGNFEGKEQDENNEEEEEDEGLGQLGVNHRVAFVPEPILKVSKPRSSTDSTSDSMDSFAVFRASSNVVWGPPPMSSSYPRQADDAAGPLMIGPNIHNIVHNEIPTSVQIVSWREVLTAGGVPLIVYVIQTNDNGISVHRYGEFRALCNRFVARMFQEFGLEAPPFPGRRVFRKLLPQAFGGYVQGDVADREFIASRAAGLQDWLQSVIGFVNTHDVSKQTKTVLAHFLNPIVRYAPESDLEQVVRTAVLLFSDTALNPIAPPSPFY